MNNLISIFVAFCAHSLIPYFDGTVSNDLRLVLPGAVFLAMKIMLDVASIKGKM
jgi:hypothetical protein